MYIRYCKKEPEITTTLLEAQRPESRENIGFEPIGLDEPYRVIISEDPIRLDGGSINLYSYVGNNPINEIDPLGLAGKGPKTPPEFPWMPCTPEEINQCKADCASRGKEYDSCRRRYRYSPGLGKLKELGLSCSCKDDDCNNFNPPPPPNWLVGVMGAIITIIRFLPVLGL